MGIIMPIPSKEYAASPTNERNVLVFISFTLSENFPLSFSSMPAYIVIVMTPTKIARSAKI